MFKYIVMPKRVLFQNVKHRIACMRCSVVCLGDWLYLVTALIYFFKLFFYCKKKFFIYHKLCYSALHDNVYFQIMYIGNQPVDVLLMLVTTLRFGKLSGIEFSFLNKFSI